MTTAIDTATDLLTPLGAYLRLRGRGRGAFLLESVERGRLGRHSLVGSGSHLCYVAEAEACGEPVVGESERDTGADLVEAARHESVVDVDARDVVHELAGRDDPADAPRDHPLLERGAADRHRPVAHAVERSGMRDRASVEQHSFEAGPVEEPDVAFAADRRDRVPFLVARDPSGRERGFVDEDDARPGGDG